MSTCKIKFGTDGWRGVIADDFTCENVSIASAAYADYLLEEGDAGRSGVVVGYDTRFGSELFAEVAAGVLAARGFRVALADGPVPSCCVSYIVRNGGFLGGVMITASHNPARFNGFKIKGDYGGSAHPAMVAKIEAKLPADVGAPPEIMPIEQALERGLIEKRDLKTSYLASLAEMVDLAGAEKLKAVYDPMFGAGAGCLTKILSDAGAEVVEIRGERNPAFPGIQPEPNNKNLALLYESTRKTGAQIGLATDGDADRIGACDENGADIDSHRIFALLLRHLVEKKGFSGKVVKTCSTTALIDKLCRKYGLELAVTPVGFKHITDLMLAGEVLIGGEESGGIGVARYLPERDGTLCGLLLAEIAIDAGKPISQVIAGMMDEFGAHHYNRNDLHLRPGVKERTIALLNAGDLKEIRGKKIIGTETLDGFKFQLDGGGWLMIRPSGTEPVLRVYCEAQSPETVEENLRWTAEWIGKA